MSADPLFTEEHVKLRRYPVPSGYATPAMLRHILRARGIVDDMAPQQIYTGFIRKKDSDFPYERLPPDDNRVIIPIEEGIEWIVRWLQSKAEKDAIKAAQTARKAETAVQAITPTTTTEEAANSTEIEKPDEWGSEWGDLAQ